MKLAGELADTVRKDLRRQGADVAGGLWALRGNWENLEAEAREMRRDLCARHKELARALALRKSLQETWEWPGPVSAGSHLKGWCSWAVRSRLSAFKKPARTIKSHWEGILAFFPHRVTSAAIEAINGLIQTARRRARGFRNFANLRAIAYWTAGRLDLNLPAAFTHRFSEASKNETSAALNAGAGAHGGWSNEFLSASGKLVRDTLRKRVTPAE
jgi:transposase